MWCRYYDGGTKIVACFLHNFILLKLPWVLLSLVSKGWNQWECIPSLKGRQETSNEIETGARKRRNIFSIWVLLLAFYAGTFGSVLPEWLVGPQRDQSLACCSNRFRTQRHLFMIKCRRNITTSKKYPGDSCDLLILWPSSTTRCPDWARMRDKSYYCNSSVFLQQRPDFYFYSDDLGTQSSCHWILLFAKYKYLNSD